MASEDGVQGYRHSGDIEIRAITLVSAVGQSYDITKLVRETNIYQNLFNHYLECDVVVDDALSLFDHFFATEDGSVSGGFTGLESLIISYRNRGIDGGENYEDKYKNHFFRVYEMADRNRISESREIYVLSGVSLESYAASPERISKAYGGSSGNLISSFVESVFGEYINTKGVQQLHSDVKKITNFRIQKENEFDATVGLQKLVIPNMGVDDTIDFLCSESDSDDHIPYFVFYEDADGFKFKNISTLIEQDVFNEYFYSFTNTPDVGQKSGPDNVKLSDSYKIISYNVLKQSNILDNTLSGMLKNTLLNLDILKKETNTKVFDYTVANTRFKKLQEKRISGAVPEKATPHLTMITTRLGHDYCCPIFQPENHLPKKINQFVSEKRSYGKSIFNTVVEVMIPGNTNINVGNTIQLTFPIVSDMEKDRFGKGVDKYLTGKYLITKVRQKVAGGSSGDNFVSILECCKDGSI